MSVTEVLKEIIEEDLKKPIKWLESEFANLKLSAKKYQDSSEKKLSELSLSLSREEQRAEKLEKSLHELNKENRRLEEEMEKRAEKNFVDHEVLSPFRAMKGVMSDLKKLIEDQSDRLESMAADIDRCLAFKSVTDRDQLDFKNDMRSMRGDLSSFKQSLDELSQEYKRDISKAGSDFGEENKRIRMDLKQMMVDSKNCQDKMSADNKRMRLSIDEFQKASNSSLKSVQESVVESMKKLKREMFDLKESLSMKYPSAASSPYGDDQMLKDFMKQVKYNADQISKINDRENR